MIINRFILFVIVWAILAHGVAGQVTQTFKAVWVTKAANDGIKPEVVYFGRDMDLQTVPQSLPIMLSADQGYELFVNGKMVRRAHNSGKLTHYPYQVIELAPHLKVGSNQLIVLVWHHGKLAQDALTTHKLAFWLESVDQSYKMVNSSTDWSYKIDGARTFTGSKPVTGYFHAGPLERFDLNKQVVNPVQQQDFSSWSKAVVAGAAAPAQYIYSSPWKLVKDSLPPMLEQTPEGGKGYELNQSNIRKDYDQTLNADGWIKGIPAGSKFRVLLDAKTLTTAYPKLKITGGHNALITLRYDEALFTDQKGESKPGKKYLLKGDRNVVKNKFMNGYSDTIIGGQGSWQFRPLWWRTWRYVEVTIETADDPITAIQFNYWETRYPFKNNFQVTVKSAEKPQLARQIDQINEVGIRTLDACAHETFMDCPYYEQSQYVGDTRIEGLVSQVAHGDPTLWRQSMMQFYNSRTHDGLVLSRSPSAVEQRIPGFALWWIGMVFDYARWTDDAAFVNSVWPGVKSVMDYYATFQQADGRMRYPGHWGFVDWCWPNGIPPQDANKLSAITDLQYAIAYQYATTLSRRYKLQFEAGKPLSTQQFLSQYYSQEAKALRDVKDKEVYSEHAQVMFALLARLEAYNQVPHPTTLQTIIDQLPVVGQNQRKGLTPMSIYFKFYEGEARSLRPDWASKYLSSLKTWHDQLALNLTTWAETPEPSRSDCHAWGSSPNYHFYTVILGLKHELKTSTGYKPLFGHDTIVLAPALIQYDSLTGKSIRLDEVGGKIMLSANASIDVKYQFMPKKPKDLLDEIKPSVKSPNKGGWLITVKPEGKVGTVILDWMDGRRFQVNLAGPDLWIQD